MKFLRRAIIAATLRYRTELRKDLKFNLLASSCSIPRAEGLSPRGTHKRFSRSGMPDPLPGPLKYYFNLYFNKYYYNYKQIIILRNIFTILIILNIITI